MLLKVEVLKRSSQEIVLWHFPSEICMKLEGRLKRTVNRSVPLFTEVFPQVRKHCSVYVLKKLCQDLSILKFLPEFFKFVVCHLCYSSPSLISFSIVVLFQPLKWNKLTSSTILQTSVLCLWHRMLLEWG